MVKFCSSRRQIDLETEIVIEERRIDTHMDGQSRRSMSLHIAFFEKVDIWTLIRELFHKDSKARRPRLFLCCIIGKEIALVTDEAKERVAKSEQVYHQRLYTDDTRKVPENNSAPTNVYRWS